MWFIALFVRNLRGKTASSSLESRKSGVGELLWQLLAGLACCRDAPNVATSGEVAGEVFRGRGNIGVDRIPEAIVGKRLSSGDVG
jgi:hypothetical protein